MLKKLRIEQFVIIDKLDLNLQTGLTILTGETGAGKSILLDATGLILGDPNDVESIRAGQDESTIEGILTPPADNPVWQYLIQNGLATAVQPEFSVYRTIRRDGGGDVRVNGKPVDLETLKKIGTFLAEIHGQFANQSLLAPENQLNLLDLSGNFPPEVFKNVSDALDMVHKYTKELDEENLFLANNKREAPKIEEVCAKFDKLGMTHAGFVNDTVNQYARILTAKETSETFQSILAQLISANGVVMSLSGSANIIERNPNLEEDKMQVLLEHLRTSLVEARAAVAEMRRIAPAYDIDTEPIYRLEASLEGLKRIAKENKIQFEDLAAFWEDCTSKLARLRAGRENIKRLQDQLIEAKNNYRHHAHILHEKRVIAGEEMSRAITAEFAPLKLNKAEFKVVVEERANMTWTAKGLDHVVFTARMNPGMPFSPVSETASGGELARLILALKVVVQKVQTIPTLIFDEVDTGIGGAAAAAVGDRLALLAENTQVLVITHSPQVASRGDLHLHVSKKTDGVTTLSVVNQLTHDQRVDELSRMLAGDKITAEATAAAQSLISESKNAASLRRGASQ